MGGVVSHRWEGLSQWEWNVGGCSGLSFLSTHLCVGVGCTACRMHHLSKWRPCPPSIAILFVQHGRHFSNSQHRKIQLHFGELFSSFRCVISLRDTQRRKLHEQVTSSIFADPFPMTKWKNSRAINATEQTILLPGNTTALLRHYRLLIFPARSENYNRDASRRVWLMELARNSDGCGERAIRRIDSRNSLRNMRGKIWGSRVWKQTGVPKLESKTAAYWNLPGSR